MTPSVKLLNASLAKRLRKPAATRVFEAASAITALRNDFHRILHRKDFFHKICWPVSIVLVSSRKRAAAILVSAR